MTRCPVAPYPGDETPLGRARPPIRGPTKVVAGTSGVSGRATTPPITIRPTTGPRLSPTLRQPRPVTGPSPRPSPSAADAAAVDVVITARFGSADADDDGTSTSPSPSPEAFTRNLKGPSLSCSAPNL